MGKIITNIDGTKVRQFPILFPNRLFNNTTLNVSNAIETKLKYSSYNVGKTITNIRGNLEVRQFPILFSNRLLLCSNIMMDTGLKSKAVVKITSLLVIAVKPISLMLAKQTSCLVNL